MRKQKKISVIALLLAVVMLATGCGKEKEVEQEILSTYKSGSYQATANGKNGPVLLEVSFDEDAITKIEILEHSETLDFANSVIEKLPKDIIEKQSLNIDAVVGATYTTNAILEAVEQCVVDAGGSVDALKAVKESESVEKKIESMETEIVVVGAGSAGTAAALSALESGSDVVLLEKTASPMGAGTVAGGLFAADSQQQKDQQKTVDKEWLYNQYMDASDGYMNSILVRRIIDEAGRTVDWLDESGCKLNLAEAGSGGSFEHIGMPATVHGYVEGGTVAITKLIENFKSQGGTMLFNTPATDLLYDEAGNIKGVIAEKEDGTILEITADAVILATGGFGGNEDMLAEYVGSNYTIGEIASCTGDGIEMAWDAGADEYGIETIQYFWETFSGEEIGKLAEVLGDDWFALTQFTCYPNLRVNLNGQRFSNETNATLYALHGAEIHMQPKETEFVILDNAMLETVAQHGTVAIEDQFGLWEGNPQVFMEFNEPNNTDDFIEYERTPMDYRPLLDAAVGTDVVFKADTIEELANVMGIDEENFVSSINQYNLAIEQGEDELFFADTERLISLTEGPFYAVKFVARNLGTLGGVRINENMQAVDVDANVIPGLYVVGADAGGMYGKAYVDFEGGTLGFAYTSGKIAGEEATEYITSK